MSAPAPAVRISRRILDRYLLDDETPVVVTRQHWAKLAEPFGTALVVLIVVGALTTTLQGEATVLTPALWIGWLVVLGRAMWRLLEWSNEWFVATDRRMLLVYGFITQRVAMMPLGKVTDMNYGRSVLGRLFGYGRFVLESAGQDQALREINWLPDPDEKYRRICATIFRGPGMGAGLGGSVGGGVGGSGQPTDRGTVGARGSEEHRRADRHWEVVDRHELPHDWEWVDEEALRADALRARGTTGRRVAVDPDPTPWQ